MYDLRWVKNGEQIQLQFRFREVTVDNWGDVRHVKDWTEWQVVPIYLAESAQQPADAAPPIEASEAERVSNGGGV